METPSWRLRALGYVYQLAALGFLAGPLVMAVGPKRVGAFIVGLGFAGYLVIHRVFAMLGARESKLMPWPYAGRVPDVVAAAAYGVATMLFLVGLFAGLEGSRSAAYILIAGLEVQLISDLALGVLGYRETMSRPWPKVSPIVDDDDW